jgi:hypothetical protein
MTLKFNEAAHRYWLDGKPIPGVTTIIGDGLPKKALVYWSAKSVAEFVVDNLEKVEDLIGMGRGAAVAALKSVPWDTRDKAAIRGKDVHDLGEQLVHGKEVAVPDHLVGYVESYVDFLDTWKPSPVLVERPVFSRQWWYAGTLDLVCDLPAELAAQAPQLGPRPILDLKTSSGVWPEAAFQTSAYRYAECYVDTDGTEHAMADLGITGAGVVHIREDGWDLVPVVADESTFKSFLYISRVARTSKTAKELVGEPLGRPSEVTAA